MNELSTIDTIESVLPDFDDGEANSQKTRYLSFRIASFSREEARKLAKVTKDQLKKWRREDEKFLYFDGLGVSDTRKKLCAEYNAIQYSRNFRLIMEKDFNILYKDAQGEQLTKQEEKYLTTIRAYYNPQSLSMLNQLAGGKNEEEFNYTNFVLKVRREEVTITKG